MSTLAVQTDERVQDVQISDDYLAVALMDGRIISVLKHRGAFTGFTCT